MFLRINGEQPFQALKGGFGISASQSGFTLAYSSDGVHYTEWEDSTPAGEETLVVCPPDVCFYKLIGNVGEVTINL